VRNSFFFPLLIALAAVSVLASCAPSSFVNKRDSGTLIGVTNLSVRWSPAKPAIGDSVHLEARLSQSFVSASTANPVGTANSVGATDLVPPNGETITPLSNDYRSGDVTVRWSFRVKAAGDYMLGGKKLFSVISVAGTSTELKKLDAAGLWNGSIEQSAKAVQQTAPQSMPQAAPQAAPGNGSPAAGNQGPAAGGTSI